MGCKINYLKVLKGVATKTFEFKNGQWELSQGYRAGKYFDGFSFPVNNLEETYAIIRKHHDHPMFMISGDFLPGINLRNIIRRKRADRADGKEPTITDREVHLICLDVDGFKTEQTGEEAVEIFISELPPAFWEADYIVQFSASYGLTTDELKCHLFFWMESPAHISDLRQWVIAYNAEKGWGNVLDPQVFVATQPIYTQRRICLHAPDPIADLLKFSRKSGILEWNPPKTKIEHPSARRDPKKRSPGPIEKYSMEDGVRKILTGESFHHEINRMALSLMSKGLPADGIKSTIKGMMTAARNNLSGQRVKDWQDRYNDIDRSVDTAFELVNNPSQDDLLKWIDDAPVEIVLRDYPQKTFSKSPEELEEIVKKLVQRTGKGKREIKNRIKGFKEKAVEKQRKKGREEILEAWRKEGIYEVVINHHNLLEASEKVTNILADSKRWPPVFSYGSGLVYIDFGTLTTIRQMTKEADLGIKNSSCRILKVFPFRKPYHDLIARIGMDARFAKWHLGPEVPCPEKLASVVSQGISKRHRELTGIVQSPFVSMEWELVSRRGYDRKTGLYFMIEDEFPDHFMEKSEAWYFLRDEVLDEFPFKDEQDAAVMVAAMMALLQRPLLAQDAAGMPGFGVTAPVQSSGKTTLVNLAATAIFKNPMPANNFIIDEIELEKRIIAILREGQPCVLFDNIAQGTDVKSEVLSEAMSSDTFSGRLLGESRNITVASAAIWFFTGNNIFFTGDFSTRIYPVNLNPKMENPDTRFFKRENILDWVLENRLKIIWALVSIIMEGRNAEKMETSSRFKIWDSFIRTPLFFASGIDINTAIMSNKEGDMDFVNKKKLMTQMSEIFDDGLFTSRNLIDKGFPGTEDSKPSILGEILEDLLGAKYSRSAKSVGKLLGKMVGRAFDNLILDRQDADRAYWKIDKI